MKAEEIAREIGEYVEVSLIGTLKRDADSLVMVLAGNHPDLGGFSSGPIIVSMETMRGCASQELLVRVLAEQLAEQLAEHLAEFTREEC